MTKTRAALLLLETAAVFFAVGVFIGRLLW